MGRHDRRNMMGLEAARELPVRQRYRAIGRHRKRKGLLAITAFTLASWAIAGSIWAGVTLDVVRPAHG
jgi:hypothetical protein